MSDTLIHIENVNNDIEIDYAVYAGNIVPKIGETLWIEKPNEVFQTDGTGCKAWHLKVVDVIHNVSRTPSLYELLTCVYVLVEEFDDKTGDI